MVALDWECPACAMENDGDNEECETCLEPRPAAEEVETIGEDEDDDDNAEWECQECCLDNPATAFACGMCGLPREDAPPSPSPRIPPDEAEVEVEVEADPPPATPPATTTATSLPATPINPTTPTFPSPPATSSRKSSILSQPKESKEDRKAKDALERELRKARTEAEEESARHEAEVATLRANQEQLGTELAGMQRAILEADGAGRKHKKEVERLVSKLERTQNDADSEILTLRTSSEALRAELQQLSLKLKRQAETHEAALKKASSVASNDTSSKLSADLDEAKSLNAKQTSKLSTLQAELATAHSDIQTSKENTEKLQTEYNKVKSDLAAKKAALLDSTASVEGMRADSSAAESKLRAQRDEAIKELEATKASVAAMKLTLEETNLRHTETSQTEQAAATTLQEKAATLSQSLHEVEQHNTELSVALESLQQKADTSEAERTQITTERDEVLKELQTSKTNIATMTATLEETQSASEAKCVDLVAERDAVAKELDTAKASIATMTAKLEETEKRATSLSMTEQAAAAGLQEEMATLATRLAEAEHKAEEASAKLAASLASSAKVEAELHTLQETQRASEAKCVNLITERDEVLKELETSKTSIATLTTKMQHAEDAQSATDQSATLDLKEKVATLSQRLAETEQGSATLTTSLESVTSELHTLQEKHHTSEAHCADLTTQRDTARADAATHLTELTALKTHLEEQTTLHDASTTTQAANEQALHTLSLAHSTLETKTALLTTQLNDATERASTAHQQLAALQTEMTLLQSTLTTEKQACKDLSTANTALQTELHDASKLATSAQTELAVLHRESQAAGTEGKEASHLSEIRIADLVSRLAEAEGNLKAEIDTKSREIQRAEDASKAHLIELTAQLQCVRNDVATLAPFEHEAHHLNTQLAALQETHQTTTERLHQAELDLNSEAHRTSSAAQDALGIAELKVQDMAARVEDLSHQLSTLHTENTTLKRDLENAATTTATVEATLLTTEATLQKTRDALSTAEEKFQDPPASPYPSDIIDKIKEEADLLSTQLEQSTEAHIAVKNQLLSEQSQWSIEKEKLCSEASDLQAKTRSLEAENINLKNAALQTNDDTAKFLKQKLLESEEASRVLEINLATSTQANKDLSRQLVAAKKRSTTTTTPKANTTTTQRIRPTPPSLAACLPKPTAVAALQSEVDNLRSSLCDRNSEFERLRAESAVIASERDSTLSELEELRKAVVLNQQEALRVDTSPPPPSQSPSMSPHSERSGNREREAELLEEIERLRQSSLEPMEDEEGGGDKGQIRALRGKLRDSEAAARVQHKELREVKRSEDKVRREMERICKRAETLDAKLQKVDTECQEWKAKANEARKNSSSSAQKLRTLEAVKKVESERNAMRDKYISLSSKIAEIEDAHHQEASTQALALSDLNRTINKQTLLLQDQTKRFSHESSEHLKLLRAERNKVALLQTELRGYRGDPEVEENTTPTSRKNTQEDGSGLMLTPGVVRSGAVVSPGGGGGGGGSARRSRSAGSPGGGGGGGVEKFLKDPAPFVQHIIELGDREKEAEIQQAQQAKQVAATPRGRRSRISRRAQRSFSSPVV